MIFSQVHGPSLQVIGYFFFFFLGWGGGCVSLGAVEFRALKKCETNPCLMSITACPIEFQFIEMC